MLQGFFGGVLFGSFFAGATTSTELLPVEQDADEKFFAMVGALLTEKLVA